MTREEIEQHYKVSPFGRIRSPGKFEGELVYMPYFYSLLVEGFGEDCMRHPACAIVGITSDDRRTFPELRRGQRFVHVHEDEQGFVWER